jgi:putative sigma-54 modulation protein
MDVIIQSLGFKAGDELERFIREKLGVIKHDKIVRADVGLFFGAETDPENKVCEIRLEIPGNDAFAKRKTAYFETSVTACVDALNEIINRSKTKRLDRRHADSIEIQDAIMQAETDIDPELEDIVREPD